MKIKLILTSAFLIFLPAIAMAASNSGTKNIEIAQYESYNYGNQNWYSSQTGGQNNAMGADYSQYVSSRELRQINDIHKNKFSLLVEAGSRTDKVEWNAAPIDGVKFGFDQSWKSLKIYQGTIGANLPLIEMEMNKNNSAKKMALFLNLKTSQGVIGSGGHDDYGYNDETDKTKLASSKPSSGTVSDYSFSLNWKIPIIGNNFFITPLVGYSMHNQNIETKSLLLVDTPDVTADVDHAYKTTYKSKWKGGFVGLAINIYAANRHNLELSGEYHKVSNRATWRESFAFDPTYGNLADHKSKGSGQILALRYKFKPHNNFYYNISADYKKFTTSGGRATYHPADNSVQEARLKKSSWTSQSVMVGVGYDF